MTSAFPKPMIRLPLMLGFILGAPIIGAKAAPTEDDPIVVIRIVSPGIRTVSDLGGRSPIQFLDFLKESKNFECRFEAQLGGWIRKDDLPKLLALVDSSTPCAPVALAISSYAASKSTVGQEALFLLEGYRKQKYPPALNSGFSETGKAELIRWCQNEIKKHPK